MRHKSSSQFGNELVTQSLDAALKRSIVLRIPFRTIFTRHSASTGEGNVEDVVLIVSRVAIDRRTIAGGRERNRGFAGQWLPVVSVGVSPYTVHLGYVSHTIMRAYKAFDTHELVAADYSYDAEWFNTVLLRIERRVRAIVAEHNVGVDFGIEVRDADIVAGDGIFEACLGLSIAAAAASTVITGAALLAIAIDVRVYKLLAVAVQVNDARGIVFAISKS